MFISRSTAGMEGRTLTTAEWIRNIFAQGMVYTRLFDEKLGVSEKAKNIAAKVSVLVTHGFTFHPKAWGKLFAGLPQHACKYTLRKIMLAFPSWWQRAWQRTFCFVALVSILLPR